MFAELSESKSEAQMIHSVAHVGQLEPKSMTPSGLASETLSDTGTADLDLKNLRPGLPEPMSGANISGHWAILKQGRLIGFLKDVVKEILPVEVEPIEVPDKPVYRSVDYAALLEEYRYIAPAVRGNEPIPIQIGKEVRLIDSLLDALDIEQHWAGINKRRFHLITKKHTRGLTIEEESEFDKLQELASRRAKILAPLPFFELTRLEEYTKKALSKSGSQ
ncbi:hypothetical protein MYX84_02140 [Acidobacteria bacterium AH-259-O06]|nr:hypothetical protein [Acidobacteria bacterium AH-259-O06]